MLKLPDAAYIPTGPTITGPQICKALQSTKENLYYWRKNHDFPAYFGSRGRSAHYDTQAVALWLGSRNVKIHWI